MIIKSILDEDWVNYKKAAMYIAFPYCSGKCCNEQNLPLSICINNAWRNKPNINIDVQTLVNRYISNQITSSVVMAGMEPMDSFNDVMDFIKTLRLKLKDDVVIYTGYYENELTEQIGWLKQYPNIVIKFGRFIPNEEPHIDPILGVELASDNQYGKRIS